MRKASDWRDVPYHITQKCDKTEYTCMLNTLSACSLPSMVTDVIEGNKLFLVLWHLLLRHGFLLPKERAWKFQVNPIQIMLQLLLCNCNSTALTMYVVKCTCMLSIIQPVVQRLDNVLPDWHITWNIWSFNSKQLFKPWQKVKTNMADQDKKASAVYNELHIHALWLHNNTLESNSSEQIMLHVPVSTG